MYNFDVLSVGFCIYFCLFFLECCSGELNGSYNMFDYTDLSNLNDHCLYCLCWATPNRCSTSKGCENGYCGPYRISRIYWVDAGNVTLPGGNPKKKSAYEDCTNDWDCAQRTIKNYFIKFGRDCNGDGVTDCHDFSMINANGGVICETPLDVKVNGRKYLNRFYQCYPKPKLRLLSRIGEDSDPIVSVLLS